jgi:hypothetical protein
MGLSALLLIGTAWASESNLGGPAPIELHAAATPAVDRVLGSWQKATWTSMSSAAGSPAYRDVANRMDVLWRQVEAGAPATYLSDEEEQRVVESALSGTVAGLQSALQAAIAGNPELHLVGKATQLVAAPNLEVRRSDGGPEVHLNRPVESAASARSRLQDGGGPGATALRVGGGFRIARDAQPEDEGGTGRLVPTLGTWAQATAIGVDVVRLDASAQRGAEGSAVGPWALVCRERINQHWALAADARGDLAALAPTRIAAGPDLYLPGSWVIGMRLADEAPFSGSAEWRVEVGLRSRLSWRLPFAPLASGSEQQLPDPALIPAQPG